LPKKNKQPNLEPFQISIIGRLDTRSSLLKMRGDVKDISVTFLRLAYNLGLITRKEFDEEISKRFEKKESDFL